jgi:hypothetical protein
MKLRKRMPETDKRLKNKIASNVRSEFQALAQRCGQIATGISNPSLVSSVFWEIGLDWTSPVRTGRHCSTIERRCGR